MWKNILIIFILIFIYKLIICISDLIRIVRYNNLYMQYLKNGNNKFKQCSKLAVDLINKLGIKESLTNGGTTLVLNNICSDSSLITQHVKTKFESAIGIAKYNLKQCFNPIYWVNLLLFLPRNILIYLNVSAESIFIKIFQLTYWIITVLFTVFSSEIAEWLKLFIHIR